MAEGQESQVNAATVGALVGSGVLVLGMFGGLVAVIAKVGAMSGRVLSFMETAQRDRTDFLATLSKIDERLDRHIETHSTGGK
jgi:hypothetical protein